MTRYNIKNNKPKDFLAEDHLKRLRVVDRCVRELITTGHTYCYFGRSASKAAHEGIRWMLCDRLKKESGLNCLYQWGKYDGVWCFRVDYVPALNLNIRKPMV